MDKNYTIEDLDIILSAYQANGPDYEFCPSAKGLQSAFEQLAQDGVMARWPKWENGCATIYYRLAD